MSNLFKSTQLNNAIDSQVDTHTNLMSNSNLEFKSLLEQILSNLNNPTHKSSLNEKQIDDLDEKIQNDENNETEIIQDDDINRPKDNDKVSSVQLNEPLPPTVTQRKSKFLKILTIKQVRKTLVFKQESNEQNDFNENITSMTNESALEKFGSIFGPDQSSKLIYTNHVYLKTENKSNETSKPNSSSALINSDKELDQKKRNKIDEYYSLERKQANLIKLLANSILVRLNEENKKQSLCEPEEINKVFCIVAELEKLALLVHDPIGDLISKRLLNEWDEKPYFGDILVNFYQFYKIYKSILAGYPTIQVNLSNLLKKKNISVVIKKLLDEEAQNLDNVNRLDMLLDRIVDFPRRIIQLLESYIKLIDVDTTEFNQMKEIISMFKYIFESSNEQINRMINFQICYEIQYMFDPALLTLIDTNRQLVKQGPVYKVAKRDGDLLLRHFALFTDILLVCNCDRIKKKLILKYRIETKNIKFVENSNDSDELMFRIISSDQNNEFKADKMKDKEEWIQAFKKVKDIKPTSANEIVYTPMNDQIGVVPPVWIKDNAQAICSACCENFTTFKRRHHCRTCGKLYCNSCCYLFIPVQFNQFQKGVRVCNKCYEPLNKIYQDYLSQNNLRNSSVSLQLNSFIRNIMTSKQSRDFTNEPIPEIKDPQEEVKQLAKIDLNELFGTLNLVNSNKETRESLSLSNKTDSTNNDLDEDDSLSSCSDDDDKILVKQSHKENILQPQILSPKPPPPVPPKPKIRLSSQSQLFFKREPMYQEYGYFNKIQITQDTQMDVNTTSPSKTKNWEHVYFVLYSDHTLGICNGKNDVHRPSLLIQLHSFNLKDLNETAFGLEKILDDSDHDKKNSQSSEIDNENLIDLNPIGRLNNRLKMFEFNFELKFQSKDTKSKWYKLISKEKQVFTLANGLQ